MIEQNEVVFSEGTGGGHVRASGKTDEREFKTSPSPPAGPFWTGSWQEDQGQQGDKEAPRGCICLAHPCTDHAAALVETGDSRVGWDSLLQTGEKEGSRGTGLSWWGAPEPCLVCVPFLGVFPKVILVLKPARPGVGSQGTQCLCHARSSGNWQMFKWNCMRF